MLLEFGETLFGWLCNPVFCPVCWCYCSLAHNARWRDCHPLCLVFRATEGSFTCTTPSLAWNASRRACPAHTHPVSWVLSNRGLVRIPHITSTHETRVGGPPTLRLVFRAMEGSFMHTIPSLARNASWRACPAHTCPVSWVLSNRGTRSRPPHCPHTRNASWRPTRPLSRVSSNRGLIHMH